jgi:1-acyl-sn-glycerol-3-phosphate acyltransferase
MAYRLAQFVIRFLFRLTSRLEIHGKENIPPSGSFIGVSNHIGRLDAAMVYIVLNRQDIILMVAEKYRESAFFRLVVRMVNGIYIDRFNADLNALREVMRRLKAGGVLVMAPEGTRSPTASLQEGKDGASYLAAKTGLPILPVGVTGTEDEVVSERLRHFKRLNIVAQVGKPFTLPPLSIKDRETQLPLYTEEIMCQIAALLPESYRGFYADHPRTRELLGQVAQTR